MNDTCVGYSRISVYNDNSNSINNQNDIISDFCINNNLKLIKIYSDIGYSGSNFIRPRFINLVEDIKNSKFNTLIVKDISRLGRNIYDVFNFLNDFLFKYKVRFISITENFDSKINNYFNSELYFKCILNNKYYSDSVIKRKMVCDYNFKLGVYPGGLPPYGYKLDKNRHLIIDFKSSLIVKMIYSLVILDVSIKEICNILNLLNITSPSGYKSYSNNRWNVSSIYVILRKSIYKGYLVKKNEVLKNSHKKIVSDDVFSLVNKKIRLSKVYTHPSYDGMLLNTVYCDSCGSLMKVCLSSHGYFYFKCLNKKCLTGSISINKINFYLNSRIISMINLYSVNFFTHFFKNDVLSNFKYLYTDDLKKLFDVTICNLKKGNFSNDDFLLKKNQIMIAFNRKKMYNLCFFKIKNLLYDENYFLCKYNLFKKNINKYFPFFINKIHFDNKKVLKIYFKFYI